MAVKVAYKHGTKQTYLNLTERSPYALYWCTDTRELFKGDDLFTDGVRTVESYAKLPDFSVSAEGILYVCLDTGSGYVLGADKNSWQPVFHGVDGETIGINEDGLMAVQKIPVSIVIGLDERLTAIEQSVVAGAPIATAEVAGIVKASDEITVSGDGTMSLVSIPQSKVSGLDERLSDLEAAMVGGVHYKGSVATHEDLPSDAKQGDLYEVSSDNSEWCWNGEKWFEYGSASGLKPIARCEINAEQFEIVDDTLNIKALDASVIGYKGDTLDSVLDNVLAAISWEDMDGQTTDVNLEDGQSSVVSVLSEIEAGGVIKMSGGTVSEPITVSKSVSMKGVNAGVPQNFYQEV